MDLFQNAETADRLARMLPLVSDRLGRLTSGMGDTMGLTRVQLQLMEYVYRNGDSSISTLRRALRRAQSSVSELTDRLEQKGLVVRTAGVDRRKSLVSLTSRGARWMRTRDGQQRAALAQLFGSLEPDTKRQLLHHLLEVLSLTDRVRPGRDTGVAREGPRLLQ